MPPQRFRSGHVVTDPVGVPAAQRGEPGVEPVRGGTDPADPDIGWQQPGQPARDDRRRVQPRRQRQVGVRHLAPGVDSGVGPAGDGAAAPGVGAQHLAQRVLQHLLDGALARLAGRTRKAAAVVA